MGDNNIVASTPKSNGSKTYSVTKWFDGRMCRFVEFDLNRFTKPIDPLNEEEAAAAQEPQPEGEWQQMNFGESTPFDNASETAELPY